MKCTDTSNFRSTQYGYCNIGHHGHMGLGAAPYCWTGTWTADTIVFLATNTVDNVDIWGCGDYDIITLMMTVLYKPYVIILFFAAILCNTAFLLDY